MWRFTQWGRGLGLAVLLAGVWFVSLASVSAADPVPPPNQSNSGTPPIPPELARLRFSPGIADIVKLVKANVDAGVIKAFINHSPVYYSPTAQEIIALKRLGVPNDLIEALLVHRPPQRENLAQSAPTPGMAYPPEDQIPARPPDCGAPPPMPPYYPPAPPSSLVITYAPLGPMVSFNNSYPTFVNGNAVYSGYYVPGYGVLW